MKVYVYTPLNDCFQIKEVIIEKNYTFYYGNYNINHNDNFIIKDVLNSVVFRIFYNISVILRINLGCDDNSLERLRKERKTFIRKNKNIIGCIFPPLFHLKGEIEFKPINCNENTVLKVFRTKGKIPFYYEIQNGEVEVVYNGKKRKKSNN